MLLPWLILIPFIGGFLCWQTERFGVKVPRWIALITMGLTLALGLQLLVAGRLFTDAIHWHSAVAV
ncbi:NADH dehydrogenase subunit M [Citrobacter braakii]|nr:NADH dehydrogenase subunit M [Citrobacter braakii]